MNATLIILFSVLSQPTEPVTQPVEAPAPMAATQPAAAPGAATHSAPSAAAVAEDVDEEAALMAVLQEETQIATESRMNADFVPGVITVLRGDELEALGLRTVWEALAMVPGVKPVRDPKGRPSLTVRGIDFPFNLGNVKILVDSVALNRESSGVNSFVLAIPIEQVERIEVIRGPGSVVHGDFAFMGLVNIITRKEQTRVFGRAQSDRYAGGGVMGSYRDAPSELHTYVNAAGFGGSDNPLTINKTVDQNFRSGVFGLAWRGLGLSGQIIDHDLAETQFAANTTNPIWNLRERDWALRVGYERDLTPDLNAGAHAGFLRNDIDDGAFSFIGNVLRGDANVNWLGWRRQTWLAGFEYEATYMQHATARLPSPPNLQGTRPRDAFLDVNDYQRRHIAGFLQDQIDVLENVSIIPGVRYDELSDIGVRMTPRAALVVRAAPAHILKTQYTEGFRAPTFFEQFGGGIFSKIKYEFNRTTEFNYTYHESETVARITLFYSQIENMIFVDSTANPPRFTNDRVAQTTGAEVEFTRQWTPMIQHIANVTWFRALDGRNAAGTLEESVSAPAWIGNLAVLVKPLSSTTLSARWNHLGATPAVAESNDLLDLTVRQSQIFIDGLEAGAGVKNVLDIHAYDVFHADTPVVVRQPGRSFWASIGWKL